MATDPVRLGTTEHARVPHGAKKGARPVVNIGGVQKAVPLLTGAVGRPPAANAPGDIALVEAAMKALAELRPAAAAQPGAAPPSVLAVADAVRGYGADLAAAIEAFQRTEDVREDAGQRGIILPNSLSWETLFTFGEIARELDATRDGKTAPKDYIHTGAYDIPKFTAEAKRLFGADKVAGQRFNDQSIPSMQALLQRMARDPRVIDVRWMAYMLATTMWETSHAVAVPGAKPDKRGHVPMRPQWADPIEETGKGRLNATHIKDYYLPVKVAPAPGGGATVTEQDGDTFTVSATGKISKQSAGAKVGSNAFAKADGSYAKAAGQEHAYYGRGYCQLTWWNAYAETGAEIGLGLQLLFNPDLALDASVAYEVMAHSMVHGTGFTNRQRLSKYLAGAKTDYVGARAMVNGTNENRAIAAVAAIFEKALMAARI